MAGFLLTHFLSIGDYSQGRSRQVLVDSRQRAQLRPRRSSLVSLFARGNLLTDASFATMKTNNSLQMIKNASTP